MQIADWNIDTTHSGINFSVRHMVFAKVRGRFGRWSGKVTLNEDDLLQSSVEVEIDAASLHTGVDERDNHLKSGDFFDVATFPKLTFKSKRIEANGEDFRLIGELTIRDVAHEVMLAVESGGQVKDPWGNQRVAFTGKASIDRTAYGLKWNQMLEAGGVLVGERIDIEIEVQAVKPANVVAA